MLAIFVGFRFANATFRFWPRPQQERIRLFAKHVCQRWIESTATGALSISHARPDARPNSKIERKQKARGGIHEGELAGSLRSLQCRWGAIYKDMAPRTGRTRRMATRNRVRGLV